MSDHPCTASKVKTFAGAFGERCGNTPTKETAVGWLCESCFRYARDSYDHSLLKMLRETKKKD